MKIKYEFVAEETVEIEVSEEMYEELKELDRREYNNNHRETRRHSSLDTGLEHSEWLRSYNCICQPKKGPLGVRTFFWTVSTPVTSVIVKQTFFLKIAVACNYLISKDWLCLAIEL